MVIDKRAILLRYDLEQIPRICIAIRVRCLARSSASRSLGRCLSGLQVSAEQVDLVPTPDRQRSAREPYRVPDGHRRISAII